MIRLGLCCIFIEQPIKYRTVNGRNLTKLAESLRPKKLSELCLHNLRMLLKSLEYCAHNNIGDFRIQSGLFPLKTHPDLGYDISELPDWKEIRETISKCRAYAETHNIRTTFHPDQFVVLSTPHPDVLAASRRELEHQADLAAMLGADVINLHCGGVYGDKKKTLKRLAKVIAGLPLNITSRLTLENDDRSYTPEDVIPLCRKVNIPFVYDVHHHRCLEKDISEADVSAITERALATWDREPLFHLSSPVNSWSGGNPCHHHDYIDYADFPDVWKNMSCTIEIEAKAKELAISRLQNDLLKDRVAFTDAPSPSRT